MKLLYKISFVLVLLSGTGLFAQTTTNWPYSMYGIGDIRPKGFGQSKAMGGVGIALPCESSLNNVNPAAYQGIDSLTFLLEAGLDARMSYFTNGTQSQNNTNINFNYFAVGFRASNRWACSIGLTPYSSIGADITTQEPIEGSSDTYTFNQKSTGGINQFYWGNSYKIAKNLSLGLNISYLFGSTTQTQSSVPGGIAGSYTQTDNLFLSGLTLDYGFQYDFSVNNNVKATIGGILSNPWKLGNRHEYTTLGLQGDTLLSQDSTQGYFTLPLTYGLGLSVKLYNKLTLSADYSFGQWSKSQPFQSGVRFVNSNTYNIGAQWMPSDAYNATYLKKVKYRLGARYADTYLYLKGHQITDMALSCGLGVPLLRNRLNVNVAFEIGQRGAANGTASGLIYETYNTFMFNITLVDFWFIKRKYN